MHRPLAVAFTVFAVLPFLPAQRPQRDGRRPEPPRVELKNFDFQEVDFDSKSLSDGKGHYGVYLPKGFADEANKDKHWPLVIWLHGFGGYWEFQGKGGAEVLDRLRGSDAMPEVIVAALQAPGGFRARSVYVNGERSGKIEDAIVQELVADVEQRFRADKDRSKHALMGVSIGGYGALKIALKHPDVFGVVAAHSSAIFPDDPKELPAQYARQVDRSMQMMGLAEVFGDPIDPVKWAAEMPMGIVRKAEKGTFANLAIYFDAGTEDRYGFAPPNEALSKLMDERGIAHTFRLVEGGGHAWGSESMNENLEQSLRFVAKALRGEKAVDAAPATAPKAGDDKVGEQKAGEKGGE